MDHILSPENFSLRPATLTDARAIRKIISLVRINPFSLDWRRFIIAMDSFGKMIGCGQVKPHSDGSSELASIAVLPEWRGKGVARRMIEHLLEHHPGTIYLTCQSNLDAMYQKFGFEVIQDTEMTPYFRRLNRIVGWVNKLSRQPHSMLVMKRN